MFYFDIDKYYIIIIKNYLERADIDLVERTISLGGIDVMML